ncbi:MAG: IS66 family insertion sequence element accessory protein TnpB [Rikenellaceae bacterium]
MFSLTASNRYWLCIGGVDMRKGFNSLCGVVRTTMNQDPLSGDVYIFINSNRTTIKLLHWERGGLVIYHKRLEVGRFEMPKFNPNANSYSISWSDLVVMIEGIGIDKKRCKKRFEKVGNSM